jgi:hypothetical protein
MDGHFALGSNRGGLARWILRLRGTDQEQGLRLAQPEDWLERETATSTVRSGSDGRKRVEGRRYDLAGLDQVREQAFVDVEIAFVLSAIAGWHLASTRHTSGPTPRVCGSTWKTM